MLLMGTGLCEDNIVQVAGLGTIYGRASLRRCVVASLRRWGVAFQRR